MVRTDSGITSIEQLAGKKVNFSDVGSGTQLSSRDIFSRLGIKVTEENMGQKDAFEALKKRRHRGVHTDRRQAHRFDRHAEGFGWLSHPAGAVQQGAAGRLPADDIHP